MDPRARSEPSRERAGDPARLLFAGCALAAIGLVAEPGGLAAPQEGGGDDEPPPTTGGPTLVTSTPSFATSDSNGRMIAVTGIDVTGSSILYVIDTVDRQLAVYQANGGSSSTQGLEFVAGRRIDLDLQVWGYNDKSDLTYRDMREQFDEEGEER